MILVASVAAVFTGCTQVGDFLDFRPPADVSEAAAVGLDQALRVTWVDPVDEDLALLRITWAEQSETVAPGEERFTAEGLSNGTEHTVTISAVDRAGNASRGVSIGDTPMAPVSYEITASWDSLLENDALSLATNSDSLTVRSAGAKNGAATATSSDFPVRQYEAPEPKEPPNRVLVKYRTDESGAAGFTGTGGAPNSIRDRIQSVGVEEVLAARRAARISAVTPRAGVGTSVAEIIDYYNSLPGVEYAERDQWVYALGTPDDAFYDRQWNFAQLRMPEVWEVQAGRSEVVVAVVDSGIYRGSGMDDLATTSFVPGYNAIANNDGSSYSSDDTSDDNSHGTHVAGTVAQSTNDAYGVAGMAYGVSLMPVKVLGQDGSGSLGDIIEGIYWAVDNGADVINLSLGRSAAYGPNQLEQDAVRYAHENGVVVVAAAGNEGTDQVGYPAAYDDYVVAVGATRYDKTRAYYSNYGASLDLVAPGGDIGVDQDGDGYLDAILQQTIEGYNDQSDQTDYTVAHYGYQGTSMASPHVAALAALLLSRNPELTPSQVSTVMQDSAVDAGASGRDDEYGYGLIDPLAAIATSVFPTSDSRDDSVHAVENVVDRWQISAAGDVLDLDLTFSHEEADLELVLLDPGGAVIATSQTESDTETILHDAGNKPGTYTIEVRVAE